MKNNDYKIANFNYTDFLHVVLDKQDQLILSELLDLRNKNNRLIKFRGTIPLLDQYYINCTYKKVYINGVQTRVVILNDDLKSYKVKQ